MRYSTKQAIGIVLVLIAASLAMQTPAVLAKVIEHNEPTVEDVNPTPTQPTVVPTFIPSRLQTPDPQNPENGGSIGGGIIVRPTGKR